MKFLRLYCSISNIHYSRIIELLKLYKSDRERYKDQYSRVLTCFVIWNNRQDVIKQKDARIGDLLEFIKEHDMEDSLREWENCN